KARLACCPGGYWCIRIALLPRADCSLMRALATSSIRMPAEADLSDDAVLGGRLRLLQPRRGHRFGHDAILLAAAVAAKAGDRGVELGAGGGAGGVVAGVAGVLPSSCVAAV